MTPDQGAILAILLATILLFVSGRWRHDMVALAALLACVAAGLVPAAEAFVGFGHPAVITVACVLVLSYGLQTSGAVDVLAQKLLPTKTGPAVTIGAVTGLAAVLSAFMNNVGALALLMPVALQIAAKHKLPPGKVLMPLAFGSILGGMTTLIGTPPNLIVSGFRADGGFAMFDFAPVGLAVAGIGILFVVLIGWRLVPARRRADIEDFDTGTYLTEARVPEKSKATGRTLREIEKILEETDAQVVGLVRNEVRVPAPGAGRRIRANDILVIEADPKLLAAALTSLGLTLEEAVSERQHAASRKAGPDDSSPAADPTVADEAPPPAGNNGEDSAAAGSDDIVLMEVAVLPDSLLAGRSATDIRLRTSLGINLLAISRQGHRSMARLRTVAIRAGDVLLLQGRPEALATFSGDFGCVPLAERSVRLPDAKTALKATAVMGGAVGTAALGLAPAAVAFAAGMLATMVLRVVPPRKVYGAIDWPVIVLLAALIPVAGAMASTGAADMIARVVVDRLAQGQPVIALALILVVTMMLSDFMNNAATAAVMCPIALSTAGGLAVNPDTFLMAVAVGASCAFLTPIGHQNNTLILGPGGFRFGDYWRLGLPLEVLVVAVGVPMLLLVWPL